MAHRSRRSFLGTLGAVAAGTLLPGAAVRGQQAGVELPFTPLRVPQPLPVLSRVPSFVPTGDDGSGATMAPQAGAASSEYDVFDALVLPPEFESQVLLAWGDRVFPDANDYVGFDHAAPCWLPIRGAEEGWLVVAHGAVCFPFHEAAPGALVDRATGAPAFAAGSRAFDAVVGHPLPDLEAGAAPGTSIALAGEILYNGGVSIVRVRRAARAQRFEIVPDPGNRRVHGLSGIAFNDTRSDCYRQVTEWATDGRTATRDVLIGTGPAASDVFRGVDADGLGEHIVGTFGVGATLATPWGTVLCGESAVFGSGAFARLPSGRFPERYPRWASVTESVRPDGTQTGYRACSAGATFGLVGEKYGWVVELAPPAPGVASSSPPPSRKHTALGRFRHGALAIVCVPRRPLVVYLGEDRSSGHLWKFVSEGVVERVGDPANSRLLERGTLFVARLDPGTSRGADGTAREGRGRWIPLKLDTPADPVDPVAIAPSAGPAFGVGLVLLPRRAGIAGATRQGGLFALSIATRGLASTPPGASAPQTRLDQYRVRPDGSRRSLADFYQSEGALLCDAHPAANLVGGTPCGRPSGLSIDPSDGAIWLSMADPRPHPDGDADARIFVVATGPGERAAQPAGGVWRIEEGEPGGTGTAFSWRRVIAGGEAGAGEGVGLANPVDLRIDARRNLWVTTGADPAVQHGVGAGPIPIGVPFDRASPRIDAVRGGLFGSNLLAVVPARGELAGQFVPFAIAPPRAIASGPLPVGNALLLAIRHPGRDAPTAADIGYVRRSGLPMLRLDGLGTFAQARTLPTGSAWPARSGGDAMPRSATVAVLRRGGGSIL